MKWIKKYKQTILFITSLILLAIILLGSIFFYDDILHYLSFSTHANEKWHNNSVLVFHNVSVVILTILIVVIAWVQLYELNKTGKADFLFRLDQQYGNKSI